MLKLTACHLRFLLIISRCSAILNFPFYKELIITKIISWLLLTNTIVLYGKFSRAIQCDSDAFRISSHPEVRVIRHDCSYAHLPVPAFACSDLSTQDDHLCPFIIFLPFRGLSSLKPSTEFASSNALPLFPLHHPLQAIL